MKNRWNPSKRVVGLGVGVVCALVVLASPAALAGKPSVPGSQGPIGTNEVLRLNDAVSLALTANPELRAEGARVSAAGGRAAQAKRWPNPELSLSAEDWPTDRGGFGEAKQLIGVEQVVPFPGKKRLDARIGRSGFRGAEATLARRRVELGRDVRIAFFRVLAAEQSLTLAGELAAVAEASAATAARRVAAGAAADPEQLRAEIPLEEARAALSGFRAELQQAREVLATLLGRPDLREVRLAGALSDTGNAALLNLRPEGWLARHPEVLAARNQRDQADLELRRARLEPYPDVKLGVAGGRDGATGASLVQLGVSLPLPLLDRSRGRAVEAQAGVEIAEAENVATENRLRRDWSTASARFRSALEQAARYRDRILPRSEEALRLVRAGFEAGKLGFIDLLETQRTAAEARLAALQKRLELNVAQAELEALLGADPAGTEADPKGRP